VLITDFTRQFKKDFKKYQHKQKVIDDLNDVLEILVNERQMPEKYQDHPLTGNYKGSREYHIKPDVLLVYYVSDGVLTIQRIGSHSELF
jgi:mRNA interferase YafQ